MCISVSSSFSLLINDFFFISSSGLFICSVIAFNAIGVQVTKNSSLIFLSIVSPVCVYVVLVESSDSSSTVVVPVLVLVSASVVSSLFSSLLLTVLLFVEFSLLAVLSFSVLLLLSALLFCLFSPFSSIVAFVSVFSFLFSEFLSCFFEFDSVLLPSSTAIFDEESLFEVAFVSLFPLI